jgi:hypothetical protein
MHPVQDGPAVRVRRLAGNPILYRGTAPHVGRNLNGPSLIAAPPWLDEPLGRYYLYFAHHRGTFIRLATADRLEGPWSVYQPGTLQLGESLFPTAGRRPHIASPDVHVDVASETVRMYYHGLDTATRVQHTRVALSHDGIHFEALPELLGRPYFRVFRHGPWWYALAMPGILYRSADGLSGFERGPRLFERNMRHSALLVRGGELLVFWSRVGDTPERILCSPVALHGDWRSWHAGAPAEALAPELPWEGAGLPLEPSVRGWVDEPVRQLRDPAIFCEDERTYLLYSAAGESGVAIAELDPAAEDDGAADALVHATQATVEPQETTSGPLSALARRVDPGLARLREASVTMAAVIASFTTALLIERAAHLPTSMVILAVALALSIGRVGQRHSHEAGLVRWLGMLLLPFVAVGASEIGARMLEHPNVGDTLFVLAVGATIWVRQFGPVAARVGSFATLPLIAMLVVPAAVVSTSGSSGGQRWWSAVMALVALAWASTAQLLAGRAGFLPKPAAVPEPPRTASPGTSGTGTRRRVLPSTKMALQMAVALAAAFAVGRTAYPAHWTWVVLTAFIVCSGNRGRGDVVHKAVMRVLGASVGTLAASALAGAVPTGNRWSIVAIFVVLAVALWLRPLSYAYWAAGMTAALALLYGYYGEHGIQLLGDRLEEILVGAALGIAASWLLLPVRTTDVIRRDLSRALASLSGYLAAAGPDPDALPGMQARFVRAAGELDRVRSVLRLVPRRWRNGADYLPALAALRRAAAALPAVTDHLAGRPRDDHLETGPLDAVTAQISALRRSLGERTPPDAAAWSGLGDAIARLPVTLANASGPADVPAAQRRAPRDRLWAPTERILGYINRTHGTDYRLADRLGGGLGSAVYLIDDPAGRRAVLRWSPDPSRGPLLEQASPVLAVACRTGWPAPAWLASGTTPSGYPYQLLEQAPGIPADRVTEELVRAVLPVLDLQAGLDPDTGQDWAAHDHEVVFGSESGHAGSVAGFSAEGAAFVGAVRAWTMPFQHVALPTDDLVHGSLSPDNILFASGQLTAVTGTDTIGKGSRLHDLATIAAHAIMGERDPGALSLLAGYAARHARPGEFEVSLAACLLTPLALRIAHDFDDANLFIGRAAEGLRLFGGSEAQPGSGPALAGEGRARA